MSDQRKAKQQLFELFDPSYWGTPQELHPNPAQPQGIPDRRSFVDTQAQMHRAWRSIIVGTALGGDVQGQVPFDPISPNTYFGPRTVLLVDTERIGADDSETPVLPLDGNSIKTTVELMRAPGFVLLRHMYRTGQLMDNLAAGAKLFHPNNPDIAYTRTVDMVGLSKSTKGGNAPLLPSKFGLAIRGGIGRALKVQYVETLRTEGMLRAGVSYQERDGQGKPIATKRIKSLTIIQPAIPA